MCVALSSPSGQALLEADRMLISTFLEATFSLVPAGTESDLLDLDGELMLLLASDEGLAEVHAQLAQARSMGISAVPTFVIDGRYAVQGGQAPEVFAQALRQAMADAAPAATSPGEAACGPDGCAV